MTNTNTAPARTRVPLLLDEWIHRQHPITRYANDDHGAMSVGPPSGPVTTTGSVQPPPGTNASNAQAGDPNAGGFNLRGIVHAAGVLHDATLANIEVEQLVQVLAPKMIGTLNLIRATQGYALDFFICYSSMAAVTG